MGTGTGMRGGDMTVGESIGGERTGGGRGAAEEGGLRIERTTTGVPVLLGRGESRARGRD